MNPFDTVVAFAEAEHCPSPHSAAEYVWVGKDDFPCNERHDTITEADFDLVFDSGSFVSGWGRHGFELTKHSGEVEHVTCFVGDENGTPIRDMNAAEKAMIEQLVSQNTPAMSVA